MGNRVRVGRDRSAGQEGGAGETEVEPKVFGKDPRIGDEAFDGFRRGCDAASRSGAQDRELVD